MAIDIPARLRDEDFATRLVKRYRATGTAGRARYSGAYFERIGGGGDRPPDIANQFTAEDLLAVTMLSVRIEGYHALEILHYQAGKLNDLLSQIPHDLALQDPRAASVVIGRASQCLDRLVEIFEHRTPVLKRTGLVLAAPVLVLAGSLSRPRLVVAPIRPALRDEGSGNAARKSSQHADAGNSQRQPRRSRAHPAMMASADSIRRGRRAAPPIAYRPLAWPAAQGVHGCICARLPPPRRVALGLVPGERLGRHPRVLGQRPHRRMT